MRKYNFSAGPGALPLPVLQKAQTEMLDWQGQGLSVMEMSHRSEAFIGIADLATRNLRRLLNIPSNYKILFTQGGATAQFSAIPLNLMPEKGSAVYANTGQWSQKAIDEACRYGSINETAELQSSNLVEVPSMDSWSTNSAASYLHFTPNETIGGVEIHETPKFGDLPVVADMSSTLLSRPISVEDFGLIYAGAQKNIGPAGLTVIIIRDDLIGLAREGIPSTMDYKVIAKNESMANTPPTYAWYIAGLVFQWILDQGGLHQMAKLNKEKSEFLYRFIDASDGFYRNPVSSKNRSWMNIPFLLHDDRLNKAFLTNAQEAGLLALKGHRSVGGMRASLYNALPLDAVKSLVNYMREFMLQHA